MLIYNLSTWLYDYVGYVSYKNGEWAGDLKHPEVIEAKKLIDEGFPNRDYFSLAWQGFADGFHDT